MTRYAVALMGDDDCIIVFFVAESTDDAKVQAFNAYPEREIIGVALVPRTGVS